MELRNTQDGYGWVAIVFHWVMAVMIFAMFALGVWMRRLDYYDRWYHAAPDLHKSVGVLLLLLLLLRWLWRVSNIRPRPVGRPWEQCTALLVHRLHYLLLFALMGTGYSIPTAEGVGIDLFGWFTVPAVTTFSKATADWIGVMHRDLAWAVVGLATIHAVAALKHHLIDKDHTLRRMLGIPRKTEEKESM